MHVLVRMTAHAVATLTAVLAMACLAPDEDLAPLGIASLHGPASPLRSPASFEFDRRSTIAVRDPRFDTFEVERALREAVERELATRELRRFRGEAATARVDYSVGYALMVDDEALAEGLWLATEPEGVEPVPAPIPRGALLLEIRERESRGLVWRGVIEGVIDPDRTTAERVSRTTDAVARLMQEL